MITQIYWQTFQTLEVGTPPATAPVVMAILPGLFNLPASMYTETVKLARLDIEWNCAFFAQNFTLTPFLQFIELKM